MKYERLFATDETFEIRFESGGGVITRSKRCDDPRIGLFRPRSHHILREHNTTMMSLITYGSHPKTHDKFVVEVDGIAQAQLVAL